MTDPVAVLIEWKHGGATRIECSEGDIRRKVATRVGWVEVSTARVMTEGPDLYRLLEIRRVPADHVRAVRYLYEPESGSEGT